MLVKKFQSKVMFINDLYDEYDRGTLVLKPEFQRNPGIWPDRVQSYLIDSIIRGKPIPKIFIREIVDTNERRTLKEVVDGQQRLSTIFNYLQDKFTISKQHNSEYSDLVFSKLSDDAKKAILGYPIAVDSLFDAPDHEVIDVFARINSYSADMKPAELRHATTTGEFKELSAELANDYNLFWKENKIFTIKQILRMENVEMVAELLIAMMDGLQGKKKIDSYYHKYEKLNGANKLKEEFDVVITHIQAICGDWIKTSKFNGKALFYDLFCSIYHHEFGLEGLEVARKKIKESKKDEILFCLKEVSGLLTSEVEELKKEESTYVRNATRAHSDLAKRKMRVKYLSTKIANALK